MFKTFIDSFLSTPQFHLLVRVPEAFIEEHSKDTNILKLTKYPEEVFKLLVHNQKTANDNVKSDAQKVYGAIHALYLETDDGQKKLLEKYQKSDDFQTCPRLLCKNCKCLPYGTTKNPEEMALKWFCPNCSDVYNPSDQSLRAVDGSWFGPSYIRGFLNTYPGLIPPDPPEVYEPRLYGFRLSTRKAYAK